MQEKLYVGVDLHKTQFTICVINEEGDSFEAGTKFPMDKEGYIAFADKMKKLSRRHDGATVSIAIESTANARFFRDIMEAKGFEVTVVNTLRFKVVNLSTKKTDKNDAKTLAEFLARDILPKSHLCRPESESLRRVLKSRTLMVQDAVALKNQAHAVMLAYGYITQPAQFQSKSSRTKLLARLPAKVKEVIEIIFETLDLVESQTHVLERRLRRITIDNECVNLLMTIPGIGIVNACTIYAYTDNIDRLWVGSLGADLKRIHLLREDYKTWSARAAHRIGSVRGCHGQDAGKDGGSWNHETVSPAQGRQVVRQSNNCDCPQAFTDNLRNAKDNDSVRLCKAHKG